jgi:hypothetical protein
MASPECHNQIPRGTMFVGKIPADLYARLKLDGLIKDEMTQMGKVTDVAIYFDAKVMPILSQYFQKLPRPVVRDVQRAK